MLQLTLAVGLCRREGFDPAGQGHLSHSCEFSMANIGGRHRQRTTGRLLTYWAAYSDSTSSVLYVGVVREGMNVLALPEGTISFDPSEMSPDEAVRQDLGRYMDETEFGEGGPSSRT